MNYIFVEGIYDRYIVSEIIKNKKDIIIIEYSDKKKEKINGMLKTFSKTKEAYIMLADLDEKNEADRVKELKKRYKNINCNNICFAIQEIEAWYLAGLSINKEKKYKINNRFLIETQNITKEKFEKLFRSKEDLSLIKFDILSEFDINKSMERNDSIKVFIEKINDCFSK